MRAFATMDKLRISTQLRNAFRKCLSWLYWLSLRAELVSTIHHNRKRQSESPKPITRYNRWRGIGICATQLPPIAASSTLLYINFANIFFEPPGLPNQNTRLNALQFAAKTHEVLINVSLSAMVLHYVQYELLHGRGVPLGSFLASFQITYLGTLWSPSLWATAFAGVSKARRFLLVSIIVLALIVGATVGPASAILMVPSLDYWNHTSMRSDGPRFFIGTNESNLWPDVINTTNFPVDCNSTINPLPEYCPLGGLSTLLALASPAWNFDDLLDISMPTTSSSWIAYNHYIQGGGFEPFGDDGSPLFYVAMTTPSFASNLLESAPIGWYSEVSETQYAKVFLTKTNGQLRAPSIYTTCNTSTYKWIDGDFWKWTLSDEANETDNLGPKLSELIFPLASAHKSWSSDPSQLLSTWENTTQSATLWVEPPDLGSMTPSIGAIFATQGFGDEEFENLTDYTYIMSCSVFATWQPIDMYMNISTDDNDVRSPTIDRSLSRLQDRNRPTPPEIQQIVKFDINWANSALPPNETVGEIGRRIANVKGHILGSYDIYDVGKVAVMEFSPAASIFFADVMSRIGLIELKLEYWALDHVSPSDQDDTRPSTFYSNGVDSSSDFGALTDNPGTYNHADDNYNIVYYRENNMTEFRVSLIRYGYIYSMQGLTRRLAAGILLVHICITVVYVILAVSFGWSCYGLRSLIEILVLAINSHPTENLNNTCAGVSRLDTYKHIIKVREVSNSRIGFVFDDDGSWNVPVPGKLYGELIGSNVEQVGEIKASTIEDVGESKASTIEEVEEDHKLR